MQGAHKLLVASIEASTKQSTPCAVCCRDASDIAWVHKVNVLGPLAVTQALLPMIKKGKKKLVCRLLKGLFFQLVSLRSCIPMIVLEACTCGQ